MKGGAESDGSSPEARKAGPHVKEGKARKAGPHVKEPNMKLTNRQARYEYNLPDHLEAGIKLTGAEVKSVRNKHLKLAGSFVKITGGEIFVYQLHINPYPFADNRDYQPARTRKLLLTKKEIFRLTQTLQQKPGTVIIPTAIYTKGNFVKLELGIGRAKKTYQKKEAKRRRDLDRETERNLNFTARHRTH